MKRFAAMLAVSVLMVLWIASGDRMSAGQRTDGLYYEVTGIHPDAVLMRINGEDISAEEYLYWLAYDCEYLTSYVPNLDFSAEVSNGMTYGSYAKADAVETVKLYALLRQWAKQYNVSLTEEDEARLQQQRQQYVAYYGGEEGYQQQLQLLGISEDTFDSINRMYLLYARLHDLYTADGSAMHPTQEAIDAFAQEKGYVTVKLLYWPASGGENSQAQAEDFAARLSTAEDKDALYAEMAQQLGIEAGDTGRTFSAETLGETLSAAFSALEPGQVSDVIATDEGWYVAIGQTLDESSVLDEMFTENVTQARSELTVEYNQAADIRNQADQMVFQTEKTLEDMGDKLDAGDFYSRLTARQSELSSQFSSGSADPGTDSGTGSSTDSDTSGEKEGGSTGSGD